VEHEPQTFNFQEPAAAPPPVQNQVAAINAAVLAENQKKADFNNQLEANRIQKLSKITEVRSQRKADALGEFAFYALVAVGGATLGWVVAKFFGGD